MYELLHKLMELIQCFFFFSSQTLLEQKDFPICHHVHDLLFLLSRFMVLRLTFVVLLK